MHLRLILTASIIALLISPYPTHSAEQQSPPNPAPSLTSQIEVTPELDAYYTNLGIHIPLTGEPIPDVGESDELKVYRDLFINSLTPRFFLLEASVFPMPVLGTYLKKNNRKFYDSTGFSDDFNLIDSVTAGFQEPYSFSLFFGDVVTFVKPGEKRNGSNKGYMGYLFTFADQHIKNNVLINDKSLEVEWKMKGERNFSNEKLKWSFRLGSKIHDNPDIADVLYLGLRRSNLDFRSSALSWLKNSSFDLRWDFGLKGASLLRQEYIIGKKLPITDYNLALKLDLGMIWQSSRYYSGSLRGRDGDSFTFVFRPNLEF